LTIAEQGVPIAEVKKMQELSYFSNRLSLFVNRQSVCDFLRANENGRLLPPVSTPAHSLLLVI